MSKWLTIFMNLSAFAFSDEIDFSLSPTRETHRILQVDNEKVRVWKTTFNPFSPLKMHRHDKARLCIPIKGGTLKRITELGEVSYIQLETGKAIWLGVDPEGELHGDINESDEPIEVFIVEVK